MIECKNGLDFVSSGRVFPFENMIEGPGGWCRGSINSQEIQLSVKQKRLEEVFASDTRNMSSDRSCISLFVRGWLDSWLEPCREIVHQSMLASLGQTARRICTGRCYTQDRNNSISQELWRLPTATPHKRLCKKRLHQRKIQPESYIDLHLCSYVSDQYVFVVCYFECISQRENRNFWRKNDAA